MSSIYCRKDTGVWIVAYKDSHGNRHDKSFGRGPESEISARRFKQRIDDEHNKVLEAINASPRAVISTINYGQNLPLCHTTSSSLPLQQQILTCTSSGFVQSGVTFGQLINEYLEHSRSIGRTKKHINSFRSISNKEFGSSFIND